MPRYPLLERRQQEGAAAMLLYGVPPAKVAEYTGVSRSTANRIRRNLREYNTVDVPMEHRGKPGVPVKVTGQALLGLKAHLIGKPTMYLDEMAQFILDEYDIAAATTTIFSALRKAGWSQRTVSRKALQ